MKKLLSAVFILFVSVSFIWAESVSGLKFQGLKKTKESYMQNLLKEYIGKDSEEIDIKEIETLLQAEGLFSDIAIRIEKSESIETEAEETAGTVDSAEPVEKVETAEITGNGAVIAVDVKEKITFIPLPFAMYSSDSGFMGGFMLMNMNAFGKKHMLVSGGFFGDSKQTAMLIYSKPAVDIAHPGFSVYSGFNHKKEEVTDFDDVTYFDVNNIQVRESFSINEKFNKYFSASTGLSYSYRHFFRDSLEDDHEFILNSSLSVGNVDWNGYYLITNSASVSCEIGYSTGEKEMIEACKFNGTLQFPVVPRVRMILNAAGQLQNGKTLLNKADSSDVGSTIMFKNFRTNQIFGTGLAIEEAVWKGKFGTVSLFETYEYDMASELNDGSFAYCHGPGAGVKLYIKQVAFPAMNLGFSYNVTQNDWKFVAAFGMGM